MKYFNPLRMARFGTVPVPFTSGRINTGTLAAGTQTHNVGATPSKSYVNAAVISAEVYPTASTGCTVQLVKYDASADAAVNLSAAISINAQTAKEGIAIPITATLTEAQRTLDAGDTLQVTIVTTGTVSVQPDDVVVTTELFVLA